MDGTTTRLFFYPGTRSARAMWMLEELNIPYELNLVDLPQGAQKSDSYMTTHPLGKVPALKIGDITLFESLAICLHLADSCPEFGLAPGIATTERAEYYKWMAFSIGTLEPAIIEQSRCRKATELGMDHIDMGPVLTPFSEVMAYINKSLVSRPFLLGANFTAADIMIGSLLNWAESIAPITDYGYAKTWLEQLKQRPAYLRIKQH